MRVKNVRKEILSRTRTPEGVIRELSCGHKQLESSGGKAKESLETICKQCRAAGRE